MYKYVKAGQVLDFETYNITTKMDMMYMGARKYSDLLLSSKSKRLFAANSRRGPQTTADQTCICEEALNNIALHTWPDNGFASFKFTIA